MVYVDDTLLDFIHLCATPGVILDHRGRILYANAAAKAVDAGPQLVQALGAANTSGRVGSDGSASSSKDSAGAAYTSTSSQTSSSASSLDWDSLPTTAVTARLRSAESVTKQGYTLAKRPPLLKRSSSAASLSSSSRSASRKNSITRKNASKFKQAADSAHLANSGRRKYSVPSPMSSDFDDDDGDDHHIDGHHRATRGRQAAAEEEQQQQEDDNDTVSTPTGREGQQQIFWRLTKTSNMRIVALAQDTPADPLPTVEPVQSIDESHSQAVDTSTYEDRTADGMVSLNSASGSGSGRATPVPRTLPMIDLPWYEQDRFHSIRTAKGEMADLVRAYDWAAHPLGAFETWPQARVELVGMMLASHVPMTTYLEQEGYVIYNDAFIKCLGPSKHPACLGWSAEKVWGEIWYIIEPLMKETLNGTPVKREDQLLFWERLRDGGPNIFEEVYATWYYTPCYSGDKVIANLLILFEQQEKQNPVSQRRTSVLNELSASLSSSRNTIDLCRNALDVLSKLEIDLPYCMVYTKVAYEPPELTTTPTDGVIGASPDPYISISSSGSISSRDVEELQNIYTFALQETVGCAFDSAIAPSRIMVDLEDGAETPGPGQSARTTPGLSVTSEGLHVHAASTPVAHPWHSAVIDLLKRKDIVEVTDMHKWLDGIPHRGLPGLKPYRAVLMPLTQGSEVLGFVITLLNPALPWGSDFRTFVRIMARQMNMSLNMVLTFEQENQRAEELAALDRAKTSFFTSISHELRTPLTLILGPVKDLTNDSTLSRQQAASISLVYRNARRLLRLVNSILDFARAEAGKLSSQFAPVQLGEVTMELASSFRSAVESAGMKFVTENVVPDDVLVWIDIDKWEKIVFNLISNAFKFTTEGFIRVTTSVDTHYFYLEVQDSGLGIPANELSSIFERFVRVENTQARSIEGSGIGLSLTLELVKAHGGKIGVESIWHKGSTFKLKIPLGNGHLPRQYLVSAETANRLGGGMKNPGRDASDDYKLHTSEDLNNTGTTATSVSKTDSVTGTDDSPESSKNSDLWPPLLFGDRQRARILLADDNTDLRSFIKSILSKYADVTESPDGRHAWDLIQKESFDLLLSDIMMPRMNGYQLLAAVRGSEKHKSMPVILLSAKAGEDAGVESLSSGADDHLNKPFSSKELILRVHSHLQLAAIRSELELRVAERTAALEESKETFQRLSELLQVGIHRSDRDGRLIWANRKWFEVLGLEYGDWDEWGRRIHPDDVQFAQEHYNRAVETGQGYEHPVEMRLLGRNDQIIDITYDMQAERNSVGDCTGFVGVFSDVSLLRKLERDRVGLEQSRREEAEQNRQLQEEFIDVTCHELRNPLNAIYNCAELLGESLNRLKEHSKQWANNPAVADLLKPLEADLNDDLEAVETILLSSRHQKRIADDVLHISKISGNLVQLVQNEWRPEDSIHQLLRMFNLEVQAKTINMIYERDPSLQYIGDTVVGDEGRFTQVCVNLISNAVKFLEVAPYKEIRIRLGVTPIMDETVVHNIMDSEGLDISDLLPLCKPYQAQWPAGLANDEVFLHVAIKDTGPGMSPEEQSRIFRRYAQASPKTYREFGGVGLGLWISRRLVELHGGAVALHSIKGVGTVFRFYIKVGLKQMREEGSHRPDLLQPIPIPAQQQQQQQQQQQSVSAATSPSTPPLGNTPDFAVMRSSATASPGSSLQPAQQVNGRKPRILVVEDNDVNLKVLVRLLNTMKCDVTTAGDGAEAIAKIEALLDKEPYPYFDLIFMDLEMPVMDGLTATQNIRSAEAQGKYIGRKVTIVAVSANARQLYADLSAEAGMDGFLRKPYSKAQLSEIVNRFVIQA